MGTIHKFTYIILLISNRLMEDRNNPSNNVFPSQFDEEEVGGSKTLF